MPIDLKQYSGRLNTDDSNEVMPSTNHKMAVNGRFYGTGNNKRFENSKGTINIPNNYLPSTGTNQCIGSFFDGNKHRIIWFNWNSTGKNGIYLYDINTKAVSPLLVCFTDSTTDILGFDLDYPIPSVNIVYTTDADGDILTWTARNKRPKQLNIKSALNDLYGSDWLEEYLDLAKSPSYIPIVCAYENDATATINNLKNKYNKFKYRYWYPDNQKSTWSSISELPIPIDYTNQAIDTDQTKNCRIGLIFQTGGVDVQKIEIAATENIGNTFSDYFSVQILDKEQLSIPDDDSYVWAFYNDEAYNYVDVEESILDFDRVPNLANTQELLNGNVIVYGGITEGYDPVTPSASISTQTQPPSMPGGPVGVMATQDGTNGLSTGEIRISLVGTPVYQTGGGNSASSSVYITIFEPLVTNTLYATAVSGSTTIADMIAQLELNATQQGFTIVSSTANSLVISKNTNPVLLNYYTDGNGNTYKPINESVPAYDFASKYNFGVVYFDAKGKTNGVVTSTDFHVNIPTIAYPYTTADRITLNSVELQISNRPPLWAETYKPVRTKNLTKSDTIYWVTDRTFKDVEFAYISIESLQIYKVQNPSSVIGYDFAPGDRIKFCCLFNNNKTINTAYGNTRDYEIVGQVISPNINGLVQDGQFIKIKLPSVNSSFDFGDGLTNQFYYYEINLYTPAKSVANNLNVYYEFGEVGQIGNAGTALAYHQGNSQNQSEDLVTPSISLYRKGDYYYRLREIRAGQFFKADSVPEVTYSWINEPVLQQTVQSIPIGTSYTVKNTVAGPTSNLNNWLLKTGLSAVTFSIKGKQTFQALATTSSELILILQIKNVGGGGVTLVELARRTGATNGQVIEFNIDVNTTIPASKTAVIYLQESPVTIPFSAKQISGQLTFIDTEHDFIVGVIDENLTDFAPSKINSNGRPSFVNADDKTTFYPTLLRWGLFYQQNTNINQLNRFFPNNFTECDRSRGDIQRFLIENNILYVYQNRAVGAYGVFAKYIQNNDGNNQLITTNDILTKDNIRYFVGEYGLGTQYTALCRGKNVHYFTDPVRGYDVRRGGDGLTPISEQNKGQFYIQPKFIPYNKDYLRADGSYAKILKAYDFYYEECITVLQAGALGTSSISPYTFSWDEQENGYDSFWQYHPEWIMSAEDIIYSWKNGQLYSHNNTDKYTNYYGVQYYPSITLVFNDKVAMVKTFESIGYQANQHWLAEGDGDIVTSQPNIQTGMQQISKLKEWCFKIQEGKYVAYLLRDENSKADAREALVNGDYLKGFWIEIKLTYRGNSSAFLYLPYINYSISNRNF